MSKPIKVIIPKKYPNGYWRRVGDAHQMVKAKYPKGKVSYDTEDANSYRFIVYR